MNPAPTPRTDMFVDDHLHAWPRWDWQDHASAFANWARDLERELTSAQAALAAKDAEIARLNECHQLDEAIIVQRTDEIAELSEQLRIIVDAESFRARKIERERDGMKARAEKAEAADSFSRKELVRGNEIIDQLRIERDALRAELAAAKEDTERLDWLEREDGGLVGVTIPGAKMGMTLRAAIDAARKATP